MAGEQNETALAPIDREGNLDIAIPPALDPTSNGSAVWCSLVPTDHLSRVAVMNALQGSVAKLSGAINQTILVSNVARQMVKMVDRVTGEVIDGVRTVLIAPDGTAHSTVSNGISGSLRLLFQFWKLPPWNPPLPLRVRQVEMDGGKRLFLLDYDLSFKVPPARK